DRGTRRRYLQRRRRQVHDRRQDQPHHDGHPHRQGQRHPDLRRHQVVLAATAEGHAAGLRPRQESRRHHAVRTEDLSHVCRRATGAVALLDSADPREDAMQNLASYLYLIGYSFAIFVLISLGLAVIFGMMRVINLAQGEFLMLGAYVCVEATKAGIALWLAIIAAGVAVGVFGIVVERLIIRFLYGRILDTLLATWGLSLFLVGGVTILYGPQSESVGVTLGSLQIGDIAYSRYSLIVILVAVLLLVGTYALWRFTRFGLIVRGTMQNAGMANAMGINTGLIYLLTFGFGSALTGLAGAVLVPVVGASPQLGLSYIAKAFITVIAGGPLPLFGTSAGSALFGSIDGIVSYESSTVVSEVAVLLVPIVLLLLLPLGITGRLRHGL